MQMRHLARMLAVIASCVCASGCQMYRPGAAAVTSPYAVNTERVGTAPFDAEEDLFFQRVGVLGHCVPGRVQSAGPWAGPVANAEVEFTSDTDGQTYTQRTVASHRGEFGFCLPKRKPYVERLRVSIRASGYMPVVIEARDLRPRQMSPLLAVLQPQPQR